MVSARAVVKEGMWELTRRRRPSKSEMARKDSIDVTAENYQGGRIPTDFECDLAKKR